ncbi:Trk system potassium transporter TrkA [Sutterella sp.]|uniref:Trk system potassium transporter TrkA n=1 Tax=Sutterella sp. TaxID=1981025 RepID=UPI0025F2B8DB|nr:Trk system potassium transporter TrkA [uncultured Sutterella sp.]
MKILIIGAGRIGSSVAESLVSEANDITVVDQHSENISYLQSRFDLRGMVGDALSPKLLEEASASDTDILIAVTSSDETNLAVCLLASRIFNIPTRIARVRNEELRGYPRLLKEEGFGATTIIWPELALTHYLVKLIDIPEALQVQEFADGRVSLIAVKAQEGSPMVGGPISELNAHIPHACARIAALFRRNQCLSINARTLIEAGDEVIFVADTRHARLVTTQMRRRASATRSLIIAGSPAMSSGIVRALTEGDELTGAAPTSIRVIEANRRDAENLALELEGRAMVLDGDFDDEDTLLSAGVESCDLFISLSDDDENNILSALLAKKLGAKRTIALVNRRIYGELIEGSRIDVTVSQTQAALDELIRYVRRGDVTAAYSLRHGVAEAIEFVAHGTRSSSRVVGRKLNALKLPAGCTVAALIRGDGDETKVLLSDFDFEVEPEDRLIIFVPNRRLIPTVEEFFAVDVGFF